MRGMCLNGMGGMMSWMVIGGLVAAAVLGLAVVGLVLLVRRRSEPDPRASAQESPEDVLRRRYAAGELDEDEYLRRRAGLFD